MNLNIERYKITETQVCPKYFQDPTSSSGFDLALCWIDVPIDNHTIAEVHNTTVPFPQLESEL